MSSGSADTGTHHFVTIRLTSIALIPLTILAIWPFAAALGEGHEAVRAVYGNPFNAIVAVLFLGVTFHHLMQGLQVVIEDYVSDKGWRFGLLIGNRLFCGAFAVAGIFAVIKLAVTVG